MLFSETLNETHEKENSTKTVAFNRTLLESMTKLKNERAL